MKYLLLFFMFVTADIYSATQKDQNPSDSISVSDGVFDDKVDISWDSIPTAEYYQLERSYNAPYHTKLGKKQTLETNILLSQTKELSYSDTTIPFGQHVYAVKAFKTNIAPIDESRRQRRKRERAIKKSGTNIAIPLETNVNIIATFSDVGHRKVSDQEFFLEFQKTIDSSLPRIRTMKMLNFFGEKKKGWKNGQLVYKTTGIIRRPFRVTIEYNDFIDQSLALTGTYEVQIFKLFAQEGKLVGTFKVDGIYKGTVTHNLIIDRGQSIGGTYDVQQEGSKLVSLPWDVTTHPLDDSQYEDALKSSLKEEDTLKSSLKESEENEE